MTKREALAIVDGALQAMPASGDWNSIRQAALKIARAALANEIATAEAIEPDLRHDDYDGDPELDDEGRE